MSAIRTFMFAQNSRTLLAFVGDSITKGIGTTGYGSSSSGIVPELPFDFCYPRQAFTLLNDVNCEYAKFGFPGFTAGQFNTTHLTNVLKQIDPAKYRQMIVVIFFAANDIVISRDNAPLIYSNLLTTHSAFRAIGAKTITVTGMNRIDVGADVNPTRLALNDLIRSTYSSFANDIADLSEQPLLYSPTAPQDPVYFAVNDVDNRTGVHLTNAGAGLLGAEIVKPIKRLLLL